MYSASRSRPSLHTTVPTGEGSCRTRRFNLLLSTSFVAIEDQALHVAWPSYMIETHNQHRSRQHQLFAIFPDAQGWALYAVELHHIESPGARTPDR